MLFETTLTILMIVPRITCSRVIDSASQAGVYVSDYCPKTPHCPEGTHVMCMYYNPNSIMGPKCRNARNISITPELANKLLDVSNAIRSKIAQGEETGKDGVKLPRGYGMFKLRWDSELATFAQVLVNQCVLRHDQCRATKRFPNPGQTAGLVRFSVPDWIPKQDFGNFTKPGFTTAKLLYATAQILKSWYRQKGAITPQILNNYPDWTLHPDKLVGKLYMEMIYGPATHMGCGVAAYTEYAFYDNNTPLYYNSIQIVCNFSARPATGGAVVNTLPPGDVTGLNPCGCPAGSVHDDDCLCIELTEPAPNQIRTCPDGMQCDPTVVLLPIFTVEDAPPEKLINDGRRAYSQNTELTVKGRHFDTKQNDLAYDRNDNEDIVLHNQVHDQRSSIFSKTPRFNPQDHVFTAIGQKDSVIPRKEFSEGKNLIDNYFYHDGIADNPNKSNKPISSLHDLDSNLNTFQNSAVSMNFKHPAKDRITPLGVDLDTAEEFIIDNENAYNQLNTTPQFNNFHRTGIKSVTEVTDNKLMNLLDTLEQEVKHIELRENERRLFDAKIKKIYGKVIGKPVEVGLGHLNTIVEDHFPKHDFDIENHDNILDNTNHVTHVQHPNFENVRINHGFNDKQYENMRSYNNKRREEDDNRSRFGEQHIDHEYDSYLPKYRSSLSNFDSHTLSQIHNTPSDHRRESYVNRNHHNNNVISPKRRNEINVDQTQVRHHENGYSEYDERKTKRRELLERQAGKNIERYNYRGNIEGTGRDYNHNPKARDFDEDPLGVERRKYYQEKLDSLQRKLKNVRRSNHKKDGRKLRAMLPSAQSGHQMDPLYMPGRARFLHGY